MVKKWTAFLRLKGQMSLGEEGEIVEEFDALAQSLRGLDMDYNIIVFVEGKGPRMLRPRNDVPGPETRMPSERGGA